MKTITTLILLLCASKMSAQQYECRTLTEVDTFVIDNNQLIPMFGVIVTDNETGQTGYTRLYPLELTRDREHRLAIRDKYLTEALTYAKGCPLSLSERYPDPLLEEDIFESLDYVGEVRNVDIIKRGDCKSMVYYEIDRIVGDTVIAELHVATIDNLDLKDMKNLDATTLQSRSITEYAKDALNPDEIRQYIAYTVEANASGLDCPEAGNALPYMDKQKLLGSIRHACVKLGSSYVDENTGYTIIPKRQEIHYTNAARDMVMVLEGTKLKNGSKLKVIKGDVLYTSDMAKTGKKYSTTSRKWYMVLTGSEIEVEAMQDSKLNVTID